MRDQAHGLVALSSPLIFFERSHIANSALNARLPTINLFTTFPKLGGLLAYGPDFPSIFAQAAIYVGRILKGANPGRPASFAAHEVRARDKSQNC